MAVQDYKINYKSDFVLNINGDAGWAVPFCIKFWTGMPSQAYFVGFDGVKYVNCRVGDTPTQLLVMFDDHHLPIGKLMMQIAYHTTIEEFPGSVFDEVTNARDVIVTIDGTDYQVMLDFTGEDAPELEFDLPAYANEAERIQNELQRQQNEADRIAAELQREQATSAAVEGAENVNAKLNGTTLTVTNRQGVSTSVNTKGEQGEQGPVGPEGPQGQTGVSITGFVETGETETATLYNITFSNGTTQQVAVPKGEQGDRGPAGPVGPQGQTGVSITGFVETGETETATLYNVTFSDGTTQAVSIPKGERGERGPAGPTGPQGPMGDVAVITPEQQAAFTMYSVPGQNTDGPMTQKAVTDNLVASSISYDNSQSGLAAENVQDAVDEVADSTFNLYAGNVWTTSTNNKIRNGSVGNPGNTICVAVTKIIDVSNLKRVKLVTNRPNSTNCVYRWVYTTFSITSGNSSTQSNRIRQFDGYITINNPSEFGLQEQEVGFAFGVLEWNTVTNTTSALRVGDFSGYVIGFEGIDKEPKYDYPVLQEGTSLTLDLFKMNVGSLQQSGVIATVYGGAFTSFPIEVTNIKSITVNKPTTIIGGVSIVAQLRIVEFDTVDCKDGNLIYNATPTENYTFTPTKKYIRIHLGWWGAYDTLSIKNGFGGLQISSASNLRVLEIPTRQIPAFQYKDLTYIPTNDVRVGTVGNLGNAYGVSTTYVIPTYGHKYAMFYTSYTPQEGCVLRITAVGLTVDKGNSNTVANVAANRVFSSDYDSGRNNFISNVGDARGIAFSLVEYNPTTGTNTDKTTLLNALNQHHFGVFLFDKYTSITPYLNTEEILNASVTELNGANNVKNLLAQATRYPRVGQAQKTKPLSLLHFSDMHGSASALRRIIAFKNEWASYINDILDTGDTIYLRYSDDWTWFTSISGSENILMTIGNHDALAATSGWDWTNLITPQQGYERYMAGIANWGATYQVNKTYYYKDYTTEKIRLIVLDCMLWDSTQLEWLTTTLASAKTAGLAVVIASHYPPLIDGLDDCSFNSLYVGRDHINQDAVVAVDDFISTVQGEFIAWVCGHTHWDKFGTVQDYPNQTVVVVDTCATDADNLAYSDVARVSGTKSQDLFNIIAFDTWNKRIKLIRIGADYDFMVRHKGTLCWDYANQKLLWNT